MSSIEQFTRNITGSVRDVALLVILSGVAWWWVNDYTISEAIGFDPLRYQYYAEYGLPNAFSDSSSYRLVELLDILYTYTPFYTGYLMFMGALCVGLRFFDASKIISAAIFSPIAFYYIGQTGKDGIAVLACVAAAMLTTSRKMSAGLVVFSITTIALSLYIRPAAILIIPLVVIQFRLGTAYSVLAAIAVAIVFNVNVDGYSILSNLESLTGDDGAGQSAQILRTYTFGYSIEAILAKITLLLISPLFQPALAVVKFLAGSPKFVLYEGAAFLLFILNVIRKGGGVKFVIASLPYVIVIGATSPFYHFRYLVVAYPVVWAFCRYTSGRGWTFQRKAHSSPGADFNASNVRQVTVGSK